jgi:hypothetical protein
MPSLAATVGLSPQHLRALARHQVGMPLARWRVWGAAASGGGGAAGGSVAGRRGDHGRLADQPHLTRWMREMVGLTPAAVLPVPRDHSRRAT